MILETERLVLRPFRETDADSVYLYAKDPLVGPAAGWPIHRDVEDSRGIILSVLSGDETRAVTLCGDGRAIGGIALLRGTESNLELPEGEAEIGYWIGRPFWGRGYIPEAARELIRRAFEDLDIATLWLGYFEGNEKSRRVSEKCGFRFHRTLRRVWPPSGEVKTQHITRLGRDEWANRAKVQGFNR